MQLRPRAWAAALAVTALWLPTLGQAQTYEQLIDADSDIAFTFEQMGVRMDGHFRKFDAVLSFDPENLADAVAQINVMLGSVDLGSPEFDEEVKGTDWFDVEEFPVAIFQSETIKDKGDGQYHVEGTLEIKGKIQPVEFDAEFEQKDNLGVFSGDFVIGRTGFDIGQGSWSSPDIVADKVTVRFNLTAAAATQ